MKPSPNLVMKPPLTLAILAAGRSTRFGRPKQLAPVGPSGEALLDYAIHDAALAGFTRFVLVIQESLRPAFDAHFGDAASHLDIRYAYQRMAHSGLVDVPPPGRTRPWGTGFAVLTAGERVDGPLAVCNADDFYGRGAYAALARALADTEVMEVDAGGGATGGSATAGSGSIGAAATSTGDHVATRDRDSTRDAADSARPGFGSSAMADTVPTRAIAIGYPLEVTLSESGGVSRGLCEVGDDGALRRLTEGLELRRVDDRAVGRDVAGRPLDVSLKTLVCTNFWGFQPDLLPLLRDRFAAFLASGPGLDREFLLSEAVNELIAAGRARCTVLPTREPWLGVTFADDQAGVARSLRRLVDSGVYPLCLRDAGPASLSRE